MSKKKTWLDIMQDAKYSFEMKHTRGLAILKETGLENVWDASEKIQEIYRSASSVVVEPNVWFPHDDFDEEDSIMKPLYDMWETDNPPINQIVELIGDEWKFIAEYVKENGY